MATELQIDEMTLEQRLLTMEALWESLSHREEDVPVPQWHKDLLEERQRLVETGEAKFIDWDTAKHQIDRETS